MPPASVSSAAAQWWCRILWPIFLLVGLVWAGFGLFELATGRTAYTGGGWSSVYFVGVGLAFMVLALALWQALQSMKNPSSSGNPEDGS